MDKAIKAALLSGLVFPGSGQIYLKKRRGWAVVGTILVAFVAVVAHVTFRAYAAIAALGDAEAPPDLMSLDHLVRASFDGPAKAGVGLIILLWAASIVDAFVAGRRGRQYSSTRPC
jgi:hypothetical protein